MTIGISVKSAARIKNCISYHLFTHWFYHQKNVFLSWVISSIFAVDIATGRKILVCVSFSKQGGNFYLWNKSFLSTKFCKFCKILNNVTFVLKIFPRQILTMISTSTKTVNLNHPTNKILIYLRTRHISLDLLIFRITKYTLVIYLKAFTNTETYHVNTFMKRLFLNHRTSKTYSFVDTTHFPFKQSWSGISLITMDLVNVSPNYFKNILPFL